MSQLTKGKLHVTSGATPCGCPKDKLVTEPPLGSFGTPNPPALAVYCSMPFVTSHCQTQSPSTSYMVTGNVKISNLKPPPTIQSLNVPFSFLLRNLPSAQTVKSSNHTPQMSPGLRVTSPLTVYVHSPHHDTA